MANPHGWSSDTEARSSSQQFSKKKISGPQTSWTSGGSSRPSATKRRHHSSYGRARSGQGKFSFSGLPHFFQHSNWWKLLLSVFGIGLFIYLIWFYFAVASQLPVITNETLEQGNFSQTSVLTDRNGATLYRFYEQNRKFVSFDDIAPQAINAFVAIEDQTFRSNAGIDFRGIARNIVNSFKRLLGVRVRVGGASTITQQLLKNILALDKNEGSLYDTIVRKHKERLLVGKMAEVIKSDIKKKNPGISAQELDRKLKERVMELYINFIYLGHQAYGIQAASQAYFGKDAHDLTVLESSILASLPQSPSYYDPYNNPARVLGSLDIQTTDGESITTGEVYEKVVNYIAGLVNSSDAHLAKGNASFQAFERSIVPANMTIDGLIYSTSYTPGRKDAVLNRMYEDGYVDQAQLKQAFIEGLHPQLKSGKTSIEAPHFVFWVRDLILSDPRFKDLGISEDILYQGGLQIKTTLDLPTQHLAEQATADNMPMLYDRGGTNRSMIHINAVSGDVLAYVGSANYDNEAIDGKVDMVRAKRQPGSSVKPFSYAYFLQNIPSTIDTPIYDIPFSIDGLTPNNSDGRFDGPLPLRQALAASRNIPAIKVYLADGAEAKLKPFYRNLGLTSIQLDHNYGYSLTLGAGESTMLEMAQAYSTFSQLGTQVEINPILEIKDKHGNVLYQKKVESSASDLNAPAAWLIWHILSDDSNTPGRGGSYNIPGLTYAKKTGTSNKVVKQNGRDVSLPRDAWLAAYTPTTVTMYRAGNTNDKPLQSSALSLSIQTTLNRQFLGGLLASGALTNAPLAQPSGITTLTISKLTGKKATDETPEQFKVDTLSANPALAEDTGYETLTIDSLCGGKVSPLTPPEQRKEVVLFSPSSITPFDNDDILKRYAEQHLPQNSASPYAKYYIQAPVDYCEGRAIKHSDSVRLSTNLVANQSITTSFPLEFSASTPNGSITNITVIANGAVVRNFSYDSPSVSDTKNVNLITLGDIAKVDLQVIALDSQGFSNSVSIPLKISTTDTDLPVLTTNSIKVLPDAGGGYTVQLSFTDPSSSITSVDVKLEGGSLQHYTEPLVKFHVPSLGTLNYSATDSFNNTLHGSLNLNDYL